MIQDSTTQPGFSFHNRKLLYKGKLVLPKNSHKIPLLLWKFHSSAVGGHSGFFKTSKRTTTKVYWEGMRKHIRQYVATCEVCQQNKYQTLSSAGLLQPRPFPTQLWADISMDFIDGLPKVQDKDSIMVMVVV